MISFDELSVGDVLETELSVNEVIEKDDESITLRRFSKWFDGVSDYKMVATDFDRIAHNFIPERGSRVNGSSE